jgi:hypothetical protein
LGLHGDKDDEEHSECMLTFIAQMDPKGWIWKSFGYQQEVLTARTYPLQTAHFFILMDCFFIDHNKLITTHMK